MNRKNINKNNLHMNRNIVGVELTDKSYIDLLEKTINNTIGALRNEIKEFKEFKEEIKKSNIKNKDLELSETIINIRHCEYLIDMLLGDSYEK